MSGDLKAKTEKLPDKPGIYFFKNDKDEIIYVGKARSLRDRVMFYFRPTSDPKIHNILSETTNIDFILTGSEREAFFLENNFVQQHQPKFNLRLKDDKSFPYLRLTAQERFPRVSLSRKVEPDGAKYFGPFTPARHLRSAIHILNRYFGIRGCEEAIPGKRTRPCLEYDIKLCSAPCVSYVSEEEYRERVENALLFLEGKTEKLLAILKKKMMEAAGSQNFEQAAQWRDLIQVIEHVKEKPKLISVRQENADILGFSRNAERISIYIFFMRKGKVIEAGESLFTAQEKTSDEDILTAFLHEFYSKGRDIPGQIFLPFEPAQKDSLSSSSAEQKKGKVRLIVPSRGKNLKLVELACRNAEMLLQKKQEELGPLEEIQKTLGLRALPQRIEGFDISNTGGEESVGSLVVFEDGSPHKNEYRKYKIKTVEGPNDVASLQEVIRRRYSRILEEYGKLPDLIVVDGGKGQLSAAQKILQKLGLENLELASLAKREEIIFTPGQKEGVKLDRTSAALKLFQHIRDEAHRFAVSYHRRRREKKSFESLLDGIPGLGQKRKDSLLARYKSLEEIRSAKPEDLAKLLGEKTALALQQKLAVPE